MTARLNSFQLRQGQPRVQAYLAKAIECTHIAVQNPISPGHVTPIEAVCNTALERENLVVALERQLAAAEWARQRAAQRDLSTPQFALNRVKLQKRPNDIAIIIGIEKYPGLPDAEYAERDALAVRDQFVALGIPKENTILLTNEEASLQKIEKNIENVIARRATEKSRVFFYFSGHGAPNPEDGQAYIFPWDGDASSLASTGYPLNKLFQKLDNSRAKEVIVALEASFSGGGGRSVVASGTRPLVNRVRPVNDFPGKVTIFSAASPNQDSNSLENLGHGAFTYYFLKGLGGDAQDINGAITNTSLYRYIKPAVEAAALQKNRYQTPILESAHGEQELLKFPLPTPR